TSSRSPRPTASARSLTATASPSMSRSGLPPTPSGRASGRAQAVSVVMRPFNWAAKKRLSPSNPFRGVEKAQGARDERVRAATDPQRRGECLYEQPRCFDIRAQEVSQLGGRLIERRALLPPRSERSEDVVNRAEALKRGVTHRRQTAFVGKVHGDN